MIAVLITWTITYFLGDVISTIVFNVSHGVNNIWQQSFFTFQVDTLGEILLSLLAILFVFVLLVGVFGASLILFGILIGVICFAIVSSFWPIVLIALVIYALASDKPKSKYYR